MPVETTIKWLKAASGLVIGFGVLVGLGALPAASALVQFSADLIFWPIDGAQDVTAPETRLLAGIGGGIMAGWGVLMWLIATRLYAREPELSRSLLLTSIGTWFVMDSLGSIAAGAPLNAVFNVGFLLLFLIPLRRGAHTVKV